MARTIPVDDAAALRRTVERSDWPELCRRAGIEDAEAMAVQVVRLAQAMQPRPDPPSGAEAPRGRIPMVRLYTDGASRGNPGPAGAGAWWCDAQGRRLGELAEPLGRTTNNVAEYEALLRALIRMESLDISVLHIFADSELMVRQLSGSYRVKNARLKALYDGVMERLERFPLWKAHHIDREENTEADALANRAIDRGR